MLRFIRSVAVAAALALAVQSVALADVRLPAIFGDHMVLQQDARLPVWGAADPGEEVTVSIKGQSQSTVAGDDGRWRVEFDPVVADGPVELKIAGNNEITITDVLVGENWLCSGQSNMAFTLQRARHAKAEIKSAEHPRIRLFTVARAHADEPDYFGAGQWEVCAPQSAKTFSAVAYFLGVNLQSDLDRPIGLINASWGGTRAEAWMPRDAFDKLDLSYEPAWTESLLHPKAEKGAAKPPQPKLQQAPGALYNGMIAPLVGFPIRGFGWYQGEANTPYGEHYDKPLAALITSWRSAWKQGELPFLVVQLPGFQNPRFWPDLRASQARVARELPKVGLIVTIDVGDPDDIHPRHKKPVGRRLALAALNIAYDRDVAYTGPVVHSLTVKGGEAWISFKPLTRGLGPHRELTGFEIAGDDGKFVPAKARVEGDQVVVHAGAVEHPHAVRYAWSNNPKATLRDGAGLPAAPFEVKQ